MATYYMWTGSGVAPRLNSNTYVSGNRMVPDRADATANVDVARRWVWQCTTGGTSNSSPPTWPATVVEGQTLTDNTVTWTARIPGYSAGGTTVDWTFATIYLSYAALAANADNDLVYVHYTSQEEFSADTTVTFTKNVRIISVNKDSSSAPTKMGINGWIGNSTTNRSITITTSSNVDIRLYVYGLTFRTAGSTADGIVISGGSTSNSEYEGCYFWAGNTGAGTGVRIGAAQNLIYQRFTDCVFRFGLAGNVIAVRSGRIDIEYCSVSPDGTAPTTLFDDSWLGSGENNPGADITVLGCDLSFVTGTLVGSFANQTRVFRFIECKLGTGVNPLATQADATKGAGTVYLFDCAPNVAVSVGDTHTFSGYYDAFGSCVSEYTTKYTSGAADQSWKIVTNSGTCSYYTPFNGPFVDWYNTNTTTAITPYIEVLRSGNSGAYQNNQIWGEFFIKTVSGSTQALEYSDRMALLGSPANQTTGAGTGSWSSPGSSAWSGKVDSNAAVTPAEVGAIRGRLVVGEPGITVYMDPQIRT